MLLNQLAAVTLLSSFRIFGQAESAPDEAPAPQQNEAESPGEDAPVASDPQENIEDSEVGGDASGGPAKEADEASPGDDQFDASDQEGSAAATAKSDASSTSLAVTAEEVAPAEADSEKESSTEPPPINPRPAGDEERLGTHPVKPEASHYKPGTGLVIESEDGTFMMAPRLRVQIRDEVEVGEEETTNVFGIRRARLQFKGHVFGENNKFKAEFAFSPRDLSMKDGVPHRTPLLSWYTEFTHLRDLSLRLGQYKLLYSRQRVVSSGDQEFVDRTIAQGEFNLDRDIGFHFFSKDLLGLGLFKYYTGFTIAEGRDSWDKEVQSSSSTASSWQYLARFEVLPFGDFKDYSEVDFKRLNKARMSIGVGYAHTENGTKDRGYQGDTFTDGGTIDYENVTVDAMLKWAGMTAFAEYFYRNGQRGSAAPDPADAGPDDVHLSRDGMGASLQVGYLLPNLPVGVGARYSAFGRAGFSEEESSVTDEHEAGGTVGYYFAGHPLKLQADYFHIWSDQAEAQLDRVRVQLQVAY